MPRTKQFWIFIYGALAMMFVYNTLPFFWMLISSFKTELEVVSYPATLLPKEFTVEVLS